MRFKEFFLIAILTQTPFICFSQQYQTIARPDTTYWLFANNPLPGRIIDTLLVVNDTNSSIMKVLYHGEYYMREITLAGFLEISKNNDKIWYYSPDDTLKQLIFDLNLLPGDDFNIGWTSFPVIVDSVYFQDERKIIQFNYNIGWNEQLKFIEGIGPNVTVIFNWSDPGILSPIVVCKYELDTVKYEISNPNFTNCGINITSVNSTYREKIYAYPNPFLDYLYVHLNQDKPTYETKGSVYNIVGQKIMEFELIEDSYIELNTSELNSGIYVLRFLINNIPKQIKIVKK